MENERKMQITDNPDITLTIRLIMQGKEVGSIIGKKGEIVKRFREQSGAKINISDGSCPERIVTVTGTIGAIYKAFTLICKKVEEWCSQFQDNANCNTSSGGIPRPPITLRLIVPASQCGSLIGKGGMKIKEIREVTGASIQVASEMLPNSTERAVTISGVGDSIIQCIYHICLVMIECPPKGATIPYRPKQQTQISGPVILAGGQAYTIQGNYAVPAHAADISALTKNPLAGLLGLSGLVPPPPPNTATAAAAAGLNPAALAALAGSQLRTNNHRHNQQSNSTSQQTTHHEMIVPNELIGCVIGKGGTKIAEIRQISGAMIRISNCDERENAGNGSGGGNGSFDRTITISGNPDAVNLAQYLINMSVELQKANLDPHQQDPSSNARNPGNSGNGTSSVISTTSPSSSTTSSSSSTSLANAAAAAAIPLAQLLLTKPSGILNNALSSLNALGSLTELLTAGGVGGSGSNIQTTGLHRSSHKAASNYGRSNDQGGGGSTKLKERNKFNPY